LAEQFVNINGDCSGPTKYFALLAAVAAASIHKVLTTSPSGSKQQQIDNIRATAAAVVQLYRSRPGRREAEDSADAGAQGTAAPLQRLDKVVEQIQQQLHQQQEPQLITAAFEVSLSVSCGAVCPFVARLPSIGFLRHQQVLAASKIGQRGMVTSTETLMRRDIRGEHASIGCATAAAVLCYCCAVLWCAAVHEESGLLQRRP
jgi:hypothetical protein